MTEEEKKLIEYSKLTNPDIDIEIIEITDEYVSMTVSSRIPLVERIKL